MRIAGIIKNDVVNGYDVCVSVWVQGCPFRCEGCHNPNTWEFESGTQVDETKFIAEVCDLLVKNGVLRNLSILGGEPLCEQNLPFVINLITKVREHYPDIKIFIWTGYIWEQLNQEQMYCVQKADYLIDGRFDLKQRDVTLPLRGSTNQRVIDIRNTQIKSMIYLWEGEL